MMALTTCVTAAFCEAFLSGCVAGISLYTGKTAFKKGRYK